MSKKYAVIILVVLALTLSACGGAPQSASTEVPTPRGKKTPKASATVDALAMASIEMFGTQTAEAALALGTPADSLGLPAFDDGTATATLPAGFEQPTIDLNGGNVLPTVTPQPTVQTVRPGTYTLQKGEFIFCLARRFNVDVDQTLALNGLVDSETLQPGLTVRIPSSGSFSGVRALKAHPSTYIVRGDDTIYSIACLYGDVDPLNIAAVNGLAAPYNLTSGAQIQIP